MPAEVFHQICLHFVWATLRRTPVLEGDRGAWMTQRIEQEAVRRGGQLHASFAMPDHVHLLVSLPPTIAPSVYIGQVKGAALLLNHERGIGEAALD